MFTVSHIDTIPVVRLVLLGQSSMLTRDQKLFSRTFRQELADGAEDLQMFALADAVDEDGEAVFKQDADGEAVFEMTQAVTRGTYFIHGLFAAMKAAEGYPHLVYFHMDGADLHIYYLTQEV